EDSLSDEYFYFYLAASYAKKGLILSYLSADGEVDGASLSVLGKRVKTLIPSLSEELFSSEKAMPQTPEEAFSRWICQLDEDSAEHKALTEYFTSSEEYRARALGAAEGRAEGVNRDLLRENKPYEGQDLNMVYSRLEKYTLCPFSYFSRYLLEAKTRQKATLGANIAGSFVHRVLEKVLICLSAKGRDLTELSPAELKEENHAAVTESLAELLAEKQDASLDFLICRLEESTLLILQNLQKELAASKFRPILFEKSLGELDDTYRIPLSDGTELRLFGDVDRIDHYKNEKGEDFVRVVDYKTGGHSFSLTDVANGLSLQMLLYLFALWSCGFTHNGEKMRPLPAGVLYLNGLANPAACENREEASLALADPFRSLSREGLLVDDPDLLAAQDPEGLGEFIPVSWGKKRPSGTANLISLEHLGKLKKRVERDFARLAQRLKAGEIQASPLTNRGKGIDPCTYCEYKPVCKRTEADRRPYRSKVSREELFGEEEEV
ncbi:MAG: PD-(D/E)XK nuclease family protein, partial [Clostridia bacterium]|nr:PD-(D/E)XK nuclease family protein [Clostridia bacterium]